MKHLIACAVALVSIAPAIKAQSLNYYVSPRYDYSAGALPSIEIGAGNISQRASLVIAGTKDKGINMLYVGARGYVTLFNLWHTVYTNLYVGGNLYINKDLFLNLNTGVAFNVPIADTLSIQVAQGIRTYDNNNGNLLVSSVGLNFYLKQ